MKTQFNHIIWLLAGVLLLTFSTSAMTNPQKKKMQTESFQVNGCCGDCKERIEDALDIKGIRYAHWNKETHILTVTFNVNIITLDEIHNKIAAVGHDTDLVKASDSAYNALPDCCQYRGGKKCHH
ncbi:MAG: cation transporter [Bacteroidia bacterium]|nr:cation transporter [Bacteroidia bacterium]